MKRKHPQPKYTIYENYVYDVQHFRYENFELEYAKMRSEIRLAKNWIDRDGPVLHRAPNIGAEREKEELCFTVSKWQSHLAKTSLEEMDKILLRDVLAAINIEQLEEKYLHVVHQLNQLNLTVTNLQNRLKKAVELQSK